MLDTLKFIFNCIIDFISMLFTIDVGFTNLGTLMCIVYIFLPVMLIIINFLKNQFLEEFNDRYYTRSDRKLFTFRKPYVGKHEKKPYVGKHAKK